MTIIKLILTLIYLISAVKIAGSNAEFSSSASIGVYDLFERNCSTICIAGNNYKG